MNEPVKKYRLGNQSQEFELREDYLGWFPKGYGEWGLLCFKSIKNTEITIVNSKDESTEKNIFLHHFIIKDAFPLSFYREERAENWHLFAIVSETETSEKFIIPLY